MASVLYITYDGILEPLGQSQVWRYLRGLARIHKVVLVSYEKAEDLRDAGRLRAQQEACASAGITWVHLRYHRRPSLLATGFDVAAGTARCMILAMKFRCRIVHARSYVPALIATALKAALGMRFIFDMRGFWADEKIDGGSWPRSSPLYRIAKRFERSFLSRADVVVSLTSAGVRAMRVFPYLQGAAPRFEVIPTCVDLGIFRPPASRRAHGARLGPTLCYLGSVGPRYRFDDALDCFRLLVEVRPSAKLLVVNRGQHQYVRERLRALGIPESAVKLTSANHEGVGAELAEASAGIFFYQPAFSTLGTAPTKLAEFLACGLPCLANGGVGDYEAVLEENRVGVILESFEDQQKRLAIHRLLALIDEPGIGTRCVETAARHFSLEHGVQRYDSLYRELSAG